MENEDLKQFIIQKLKSELSDKLTYHGLHHTLRVLEVCNQYIDRLAIQNSDAKLLRTAAIFHDTGFLWSYENHEEYSIKYMEKVLPGWNYTGQEIEKIAGIIQATKIPQKPHDLLEQIMGDADLDYLGTDLFYEEGESLYKELRAHQKISSREQWDKLQVTFLKNHHYHTQFAQENREPLKQKHLQEILDKNGW